MFSSSRSVVRLVSRVKTGPRVTSTLLPQSSCAQVKNISINVQSAHRDVDKKLLSVQPSFLPSHRHFSDLPPHVKVALPALSPTMELGTIVSWEKKEGDQVSEGDLLCEIETDKATMGFETPEEGYLAKIVISAGTKDIPIGKLLCIIVENQEDVEKFKDFVDDGPAAAPAPPAPKAASAPAPAAAPPPPPPAAPAPAVTSPAPRPVTSAASSGGRVLASPAAKRVAAERGINLAQISQGSGMDGMITSRDVENFKPDTIISPTPVMPMSTSFPSVPGSGLDLEASNVRKVIAKRLQQSKHQVPHFYLTVECNMDKILKLRQDINTNFDKDVKLSVNDFIIKAAALSCKKIPACNSAWMDTFIRQHNTVDMSIAVDTGSGLITPIIRSAETKGLAEISSTVKELAARAKAGKLQPQEFQGGSFTISNLGMFGISQFTAIINQPQSCILAVGGTEKKVVAGADGQPGVSSVMRVTMSCDHRVVDGAVGAQWLQFFKKFIENPQTMLL